jgi:hypothetical protein
MTVSSVVIDDLDVFGAALRPDETDTPSLVYTDAVLAPAIALQGFETVVRRYSKVFEAGCAIEHRQLSNGHRLDFHESAAAISFEQGAGVIAFERLDRH